MIVSGKLTSSMRRNGRRQYIAFSLLNGVSYICLTENILVLFALKMGCPDYFVAILTSFTFLGSIFMLFGKELVGRYGACSTIGIAWMLRNLFALLTAVTPIVAIRFGEGVGMAALAICAFGFFASRAMGSSAWQPAIGDMSTPENRGRFTSNIFRSFNISAFLTMLVIIFLFQFSKSIQTFQGIIIGGAFFGIISALVVYRIKESETPKMSALQPLREAITTTWRTPRFRKFLFAKGCAFSTIALVLPVSMLALKEGYGITDDTALLFALCQLIGGVVISLVLGLLSQETGPRPLLILFIVGLIFISLLWIAAPTEFNRFYAILIFFIAGACYMGIITTSVHYFLILVPDENRVGTGLFVDACSGIFAGLSGILIAGCLIKFLHGFDWAPIVIYRAYFSVIIFILIIYLFVILRMERIRDWGLTKVLSLPFAVRDMQALYLLYKTGEQTNSLEETENIAKLHDIKSDISERTLLSYLDSPKFYVRAKALIALSGIHFSGKANDFVLRELKNCEYSTAYIAAQIAGEKGIGEAIPFLRTYLESKDLYLQGKSMLSLAQLKDRDSYLEIEKIFRISDNPRIIIHGAAALTEIGDREALGLLLKKALELSFPAQIQHELICAISDLSGCGDEFYQFLKSYKKNPDEAVCDLADFTDIKEMDPQIGRLKGNLIRYHEGMLDIQELLKFIIELCDETESDILKQMADFVNEHIELAFSPELIYCITLIIQHHLENKT